MIAANCPPALPRRAWWRNRADHRLMDLDRPDMIACSVHDAATSDRICAQLVIKAGWGRWVSG
jgi:hypothetical protein